MKEIPAGVVLDNPLAEALLFAAVRERLVDDEPSIGDGFVARLLRQPPSQELIDAAFEQLVLGGAAILPIWMPPRWDGELFESRTISTAQSPNHDKAIEVSSLPADVVLGMLAARGVVWSESELKERYDSFLHAYRDWESVAEGKSFDAIEIRMILRGITKDVFDGYTPEQLAAWERVQGEYRKLKPVYKCVEDYSNVLSISLEANALSSVPVVPSSLKLDEPTALPAGTQHLQLFRIACSALRRVPIARTLRETLKIAHSDEASDLRARLARWTDASRKQDIDAAELAIRDIEHARRALSGAKRAARVGEYATWIGLPVSIGGAFITGPIGAIAGITISVAGVIAVGAQKTIERLNRWAMFGAE